MNEIERNNQLNLLDVQRILVDSQVLVAPEDDRNLVEIASALGLIGLTEITQNVASNGLIDPHRLLMEGIVLQFCNGVVRVMQAVER